MDYGMKASSCDTSNKKNFTELIHTKTDISHELKHTKLYKFSTIKDGCSGNFLADYVPIN